MSLTPDTHSVVVTALDEGASFSTAAKLARVSPSTLEGWLAKGRADSEAGRESDYSRLWGDALHAAGSFELRTVRFIVDAAADDDRNAGTLVRMLERSERIEDVSVATEPVPVFTHLLISDPQARDLSNQL